MNTINEILNGTISSYQIINLPERYKENILRPSELPSGENNQVLKILKLNQ